MSYGVDTLFDVCESNCDPTFVNWNCCTSSAPCTTGGGDCDSDSDCLSGYCEHDVGLGYGVSYSMDVCAAKCPPTNLDWSCCTSSSPCGNGEGDCDNDSECLSGYCSHDVGANYGLSSTSFDVCEAPTKCFPANMDWGCCTSSSPCADGLGDCDSDSDCTSGYCSHDA